MGGMLTTRPVEDARERQRARRLAAREFRPRRTAAGVCAALLVTAAGGAAAVVLPMPVLPGAGARPVAAVTAPRWLRGLTWEDPVVLGVAAVVAAIGLALLLAALPGRPRALPLDGTDPRLAGAVRRSALRRTLADAALDVPGVETARVRLRPRGRVTVRARSRFHNPANLADLVHGAVHARLSDVELMRGRRVAVRLTCRKD